MLTIENFEDKLHTFVKSGHSFRNDWKIYRVINSNDAIPTLAPGLEHYSVFMDGSMVLEIRLWRNADEEFMTEHDAKEGVYRISFVDVVNTHIIYEHFVSKNWLEKKHTEFMTRMVDIICDVVIDHPNNLYNGAVPF